MGYRIAAYPLTLLNSAVYAMQSALADLAEAGVKRISVGSALARLALGAVVTAAREMALAGTFRELDQAMGFAELEAFFT